MFKEYIVEFTPILLAILFAVYAYFKFAAIISSGLNRNHIQLFLVSLFPFSKSVIRNTFHEKLKRYYKKSNKLNYVFYVLFFIVITLYLMMSVI